MSDQVRVSFRDGRMRHVHHDAFPVGGLQEIVRVSNIEPATVQGGGFQIHWKPAMLAAFPQLTNDPVYLTRAEAVAEEVRQVEALLGDPKMEEVLNELAKSEK